MVRQKPYPESIIPNRREMAPPGERPKPRNPRKYAQSVEIHAIRVIEFTMAAGSLQRDMSAGCLFAVVDADGSRDWVSMTSAHMAACLGSHLRLI